ncbi:MAG: DUF4091 domain-containing protein, partial [Bacteroidales bacterium]|nr:DUF4091 domain-containing protein [Bacteroidales bacterium]
MKPYSLYIFIFLAVFCISCIQEFVSKLPHEPEDPDTYDMSVWEELEPGIHSGFGSIDIAYPKSIPPSGDIEKSIKLHGWKGERVNCKLLVWSANADEQVSIDLQEFNSDDLSIGNKQISISVIKYVLTDEFLNERSTACGPRDNDKIPAHLQADILSHENVFIAEGRGTRPVWISIDIPSDAIPGIYESVVSRKSPSGRERHLITLEVQDKLLPPSSEWSFHLDLWQNPFAVARYNGVELWSEEHFELLKPLLGKLADAGQKCITTTLIDKPWGDNKPCYDDFRSMIRWTRKKDGSWEYDYSIFDKYVRLAMACGIKEQINCYSMVPIHNKFTWYDEKSADTIIMEAFPGTEDYEMIWTGFLSDFRDHLDEMGWLDKTTIALDEREEEEMKDLFSFLKETAPEFKIAMAGFYYEALNPSIYDFSSNWRHTGIMSDGVIDSRRSSDLKTTYYVACGIPEPNSFTFSPPAESCYVGWFAAAEGFDGFLRWAYNSWPEEPLVDSRYTKWPAGDT